MKLVKLLLSLPFKIYKFVVSPLYSPCCKFVPSCSEYAEQAISKYGILKGGWLTLKRLAKCHPFSKKHGLDEVP